MDAKQRFYPSMCTSYSISLCDAGTHCSIAYAWWGNNLPRLAKLSICSLNLTGSSAFHPVHPLPSKKAVPSPELRKLFLLGSEAPLALSPVQTTCPNPDIRMTWRKIVLQMGCSLCIVKGMKNSLKKLDLGVKLS